MEPTPSESSDDVLVTGEVQTDSRLVGPGDVFIAMPGEVTDGHRFAADAVAAGAALVIAERELDVAAPVVVVPRGLDALWALARESSRASAPAATSASSR